MPLFAEKGFDGVSMRDIARAVGVKAPALYNHFSDKQALYLAVVSHAFYNKATPLIEALSSSKSAENRLKDFIRTMTRLMSQDRIFSNILQRELLDGDEHRLKFIGETMFSDLFQLTIKLFQEINPNGNNQKLLAISVIGMIRQHFEFEPLYRFLPGAEDKPTDSDELAQHIYNLLMTGIKG